MCRWHVCGIYVERSECASLAKSLSNVWLWKLEELMYGWVIQGQNAKNPSRYTGSDIRQQLPTSILATQSATALVWIRGGFIPDIAAIHNRTREESLYYCIMEVRAQDIYISTIFWHSSKLGWVVSPLSTSYKSTLLWLIIMHLLEPFLV